MRRGGAGLQARQVEQVADEADQPVDLESDRLEQAGAIVGVERELAALEAVHGRRDRCERRSQVVRHALEHRGLDGVRLLESVDPLSLVGERDERGERSLEPPARHRVAALQHVVGSLDDLVERCTLQERGGGIGEQR